MKPHPSKIIRCSLLLILGIYLLMPTVHVMAQDIPVAQPGQKPETMSPAEVDGHIAGMSDENVRQAYAQKLKQENT